MKKSVLIVKSLLLAFLVCLTFFNLSQLLQARQYLCEMMGAPKCNSEAWDYCVSFCEGLDPSQDCESWYFLDGECQCSALCVQWWRVVCDKGGSDIYECETFWGGCPL